MSRRRWDEPRPPKPWERKEDHKAYWQRIREEGWGPPEDGLRLGTNIQTQRKVFITPDQLATHMHIIGGTGGGKSFLMEAIIKQIMSGAGVCVIDPHGDLYERLLDYCAHMHFQRPDLNLAGRVIPFNVADTRHVLGFNPMARNARVMTYQVVAMMEAIRKCWGQDDFNATPRLARWLFNTCHAIIDSGLTMVQMYHMIDPKASPQRAAITAKIKNPLIRAEWEWIGSIKEDKKEERLESTFNRMRLFVMQDIIKNIVGQYTKTIDFPAVLAERKILLVNLARQSAISQEDRHMLGTLFVNELLTAAFARPRGERTPFFLFADEFQNFVTKDMCEILDGGRKFGIHLTIGHQSLGQLKEKDPEVYYSTMTNARTKVVFGGLSDEDLQIMGRELYVGELNPDEVKDEIWHTVYDPVETTRVIHSSSFSDSSSESLGDSEGIVTHESLARGEVYIPGSGWLSPDVLASTSTSAGSGSGSSRGRSSSSSSSWSSSSGRTEVPWYEFHPRQQLANRTFRQLEEQLYIKMAAMKRQPRQHATLLIPETNTQLIKAVTVRDFTKDITNSQRQDFLSEAIERAGCFKSPEEAAAEIAACEKKLLAKPVIDVEPEPPPKTKRTRRTKEKASIFDNTPNEDA